MQRPEQPARRWFAPEVVQTSAMDCGPAALKCLLEGFHIPVSYGRLREACQTHVDGTSIDKLEEVANQLGVHAEQTMIPVDHVLLADADVLPAMVVVRLAQGTTHFVVVWRRHGRWLQVMDPAIGRRWVTGERFREEIYQHELLVPVQDWFEWASSAEFLQPLQQRLALLGVPQPDRGQLVEQALNAPDWLGIASLDAGVRLVNALVTADGIAPGRPTLKWLHTLLASLDRHDLYQTIPQAYWSVLPEQPASEDPQMLLLKGAVLLQIQNKPTDSEAPQALAPELAAALTEKPYSPLKTLWDMLRTDGLLSPWALMGALAIAAAAIVLEALLFRGIFDLNWALKLPEQRLGAIVGLLGFVSVLLCFEVPIAMESLRFGRQLETRLRMALLRKLPHMSDRYFQSRPVSDMAERSHSIALLRQVPNLGIQAVQTFWELLFTLIGICLIAPASGVLAGLIGILVLAWPLLAQPVLNETELRVRSHAGAMLSFYLDALLGLVPIRSHCAETAVRREHEGLLVEWARASRNMLQLSLATEALQALLGNGLVVLMLYQHFARTGVMLGGDLLLVYWALKLPAIGQKLSTLAHQYPAQRNILLRLLEPLATPEEPTQASSAAPPNQPLPANPSLGVNIELRAGQVVAAGHPILQALNLQLLAGEQVAIVGSSGAGKSSLLGLLLGWHRLAEGELQVDGIPLQGAQQLALRQATAWVDPGVQLWNRTLLDNLTYSSDNGDFGQLAQVLDAADLKGILQKLPAGLQTFLGEGGTLLSAGEGQRVRLARALMQTGVRLVLLDEPFRGLDRQQRGQLLQDARQWWVNATLLCVTHDIAETLSFPRVLVVEDGQIIEDGVPQQLAACASRYRDLLAAEQAVQQKRWQGKDWRPIQVSNGGIQTPAAGSNES